jgi:hypothetical protein
MYRPALEASLEISSITELGRKVLICRSVQK